MKLVLGGVSCIAVLAGLGPAAFAQVVQTTPDTQALATQDPAQQPPQTVVQTPPKEPAQPESSDRVVIVGSHIATRPEDAPKPVEVYTMEDLQNQGSPSVTDFIRSLTISGYSAGQNRAADPGTAGFGNIDLRGQGFNGTTVLMNGRNLATTNGGAGADINTIPMEALQAVEILKDGASSTYGAGAVGGVVNFRTRRDIDAPILTVERTMYEGSEGGWKYDFITGWVGDSSNLMISLSYLEEDGMLGYKRDWSVLPYDVNPNAWLTLANNPGRWLPAANIYTSGAVIGGSRHDVRPASFEADCAALGTPHYGAMRVGDPLTEATLTGSTYGKCALPRGFFEDLINKKEQTRLYAEFNSDLSNNMEFHADLLYSIREEDARNIGSNPVYTAQGATTPTISALCASVACNYVVPFDVRLYDEGGVYTGETVRNPFASDFLARTGLSPATAAVFSSTAWQPFAAGPNPLFDDGYRHQITERERYQINMGVKGEFTQDGFLGDFLNGVNYDYAAQLNQYTEAFYNPGIIVSRLQNALLGYGGPNCQAVDHVPIDYSSPAAFNRTVGIQSDVAPGTNGCEFFNPFASAFQYGILGGLNPQYGGVGAPLGAAASSWENSRELVDWMTHPRELENQRQSLTFDALWTGELPQGVELPGGPVGWALGTQWRQTSFRATPIAEDDIMEQLLTQQCPYPDPSVETSHAGDFQSFGQYGCTYGTQYPGPGAFFSALEPAREPGSNSNYGVSFFGEVQLPVFDNLNANASFRREDYNGGKVTGDIYSLAAKYDITDDLYVRISYGTNFRAENILDLDPGVTEVVGQATFRLAESTPDAGDGVENVAPIRRTIAGNLQPEESTTMNIGIGYTATFGESRFLAKVDFFRIEREGQLAASNSATIIRDVFGSTSVDIPAGGDPLSALADCSANLIQFLSFRGGSCVQGTTTAFDIAEIQTYQQNGPGFLTEGLDVEFDYSQPLFDGRFGANLKVTHNLSYESKDFTVNGVLFEAGSDRLGTSNSARTPPYPFFETKANATLRWGNRDHRINLRANYISGITPDEMLGLRTFTSIGSAGGVPIYSSYASTAEDYVDFDLTYIYQAPFMEGLELSAAVINLTDENPMVAQNTQGYYEGMFNPRGRQMKLTVKKQF